MLRFLSCLAISLLPLHADEMIGVFALTDTPRDSFPANGGARMRDLFAKGVRMRSLELSWRKYEPQDDAWDEGYLDRIRPELAEMRKQGFLVVLDLGLQYAPQWAIDIRPMRDHFGNVKTQRVGANTIFNAKAREEVAEYLHRIAEKLGTDFHGVRISSGVHPHGEILYPDGAAMNGYWAWDEDARAQCPPSCRDFVPSPGSGDPRAAEFYAWYCDSLARTVYWMLDRVRENGYPGKLILECPGVGVQPKRFERVAENNAWSTTDDLMINITGVRYDRIIDGIPDKRNIVIMCSSLNDGTANRPETGTYPDIETTWSSAKYLAHLADRNGLGKWGEGTGQPPNDAEKMKQAFAKMREHRYTGLFWAWEYSLYDGKGKATAEDFGRLIRER